MYEKVKNQFNHTKESNDDICKFNSLWISFNCFYNLEFNKGNDRNNIDFIKNNTKIKEIFKDLDSGLKEDFFNFIRDRGGINSLKNGNIIFNVSYICKECFGEFLEIIYTIRNNQFHGGKDWIGEKDILINANKIFEPFLKEVYNKYGII